MDNNNNETMSNWSPVAALLDQEQPIHLGRYASYQYLTTPRRLLYASSYYKFAAKMIGHGKRVLDIGCNEGLGSWLIAKECGFCKGVDFDEKAIEIARRNFSDHSSEFVCCDFDGFEEGDWDGVISFDVIEHIETKNASHFLKKIARLMNKGGIAVIGTPSEISQHYASAVSKQGHINIYSPERFEMAMREHFEFVFLFSAHDEVIHTGYLPLAHYLIALVCKPK